MKTNATDYRIYGRILMVLALLISNTFVSAQNRLCLEWNAEKDIVFEAGTLNEYLDLDKYKVILFGEQHNNVFDPQIKYELITEAHRHARIRHVFLEISVSNAWHFNRYLHTGDSNLLYILSAKRQKTPYMHFWERLYLFNRQLPDTGKIVIHGIDFETTSVFQTLLELAPAGAEIPQGLRRVMDTIYAHRNDPPLKMWNVIDNKFVLYDNASFVKTLRYVQDALADNLIETKIYFGINASVVLNIAANRTPVEVRAKRRNRTMSQAIKKITAVQGFNRFIGFFGNQHTSYGVPGSLGNNAAKLHDINRKDVLNISEIAYNLKAADTAFRIRHFQEIVNLNGSCGASLLPASYVPGFRKSADFVVITDIYRQ
ncbi:MAG: hypothetical protein EOP49_16705 [Sphingobacteriales bacterium]|nr:MAG: hypothetical protein EOP49_16705 [Sphingobacteriales bacterium]